MSSIENRKSLLSPELKLTSDGSHTLYVPSLDEHYHSHLGAVTESKHIFINIGLAGLEKEEASILEVGFGTGLNALLTALYAEEKRLRLKYVTLEKYPVDMSLLSQLNYGSLTGKRGDELFSAIHAASWDMPVRLTTWFIIEKRLCDLTITPVEGIYDVVFFDAFGPDKQPEMWSSHVLEKITNASRPGTVFVTYSAKGELKRSLRALGFEVTLLPGPPGKRVMTRAVKI
jgi:tRNA U34 5-methylaminomethyl-2-thiouridine-forming methyltransferase MnmC